MIARIVSLIVALTFSAAAYAAFAIFQASNGTNSGFNTTVFNCSSGFAATGSCGTDATGSQAFWMGGTSDSHGPPSLSGSQVLLIPNGAVHVALNMNYQTQVDIRKFQTTITFIPNGMNFALIINNSNNQTTFNTNFFSAGAGCEAAFFQGFPGIGVPVPNNVFALEWDSYSPLTTSPGTFSYSSAQWYWANGSPNAPNPPGQSPCIPDQGQAATPTYTYVEVDKFSTYPVPMNTGCTGTPPTQVCTQNTSTGDVYSATITYSNVTQIMDLLFFDVTAGGTCTPNTSATCYHQVWTGVDIPTAVGGNLAWFGWGGATGIPSSFPMLVTSAVLKTP